MKRNYEMKKRIFTMLLCVCMFMGIVSVPAMAASKNLPDEIKAIASDYEWEVLKLVNIERAKEGIQALSMLPVLQEACDVRANDLEISYSHTRPDGSVFSTAIPSSFKASIKGENIAIGQKSPTEVMEAWMNSPGHRANILNQQYGYIGVGYNEKAKAWVQIFSKREAITAFQVSTEQKSLNAREMENVYMTLTTADGCNSYMPLSFDSMKEENGNYTPRIKTADLPVFTYRYGPAAQTGAQGTAVEEVKESKGTVFTDVLPDAYYALAVNWAVNKNITSGTSETTFSPDDTCTRAQILSFLWRAVGSPKAEGTNPFTDVSNGRYYYDAAVWAYEKGMVSENTFAAETPCTRASTVMYLWKNAGSPDTDTKGTFTDVPADADYTKAVSWAVQNGITSGTGETTFSPDMTCTRGQIVTFLNRAIK